MAAFQNDCTKWFAQPLAIFPQEIQNWNAKGNTEEDAARSVSKASTSEPTENLSVAQDGNSTAELGTDPKTLYVGSDSSHDTVMNYNPDPTISAASRLFPMRSIAPCRDEIHAGIRECLKIQARAVQNGKLPFGACLIGPDNTTVILAQGNVDHVNHAECTLARSAAAQLSQEYLWTCTLYSTWEPCAMCASTIYWANIGRIVFAASNDQLLELTGKNNTQNMTMRWHCRDILSNSQKDIEIIGPIQGIDNIVMMESDLYWSRARGK